MQRILLSFLLLSLIITLSPNADAQTFEEIDFKLNNGGTVAVEKGEIFVPENRSNPESRAIPIRFLRLKSRAARPAHPIIYLAGGPGGSGTGAARGRRWEMFDTLRNVADVIILDQRGTGMSNTIPFCQSSVKIDSNDVTNRKNYTALHRTALRECLAFWQTENIDIRGYTTWESAADIEAVREALNAEKVNLLGISYGTHLALATVKRYPEKIDRLVLVSAEGLDQTVKRPAQTEAYFTRLQRALDQDSVARERVPDARNLIKKVLDQVEANPPLLQIENERAGITIKRRLGKFELQLITGYMLSDPGNAVAVLEGYLYAAEGDYTWFQRYMQWVASSPNISFSGMAQAMDIASGISPARLQQIESEADTALLGDALNFPMPQLLGEIPGIDLGSQFRSPFQSDRPALLFSGTLDGRTYPEAQAEVASRFKNSTLVTVENGGHNLFFSHPEVVDLIFQFFAGKHVKAKTLVAPLPAFMD